MTKTSTIVVPIDLATGSKLGFESAARVAELLGADRLHLVHVVRDLSAWMRDVPSYSGGAVLEALTAIRKSAEARLAEISPREGRAKITREVRIGTPAREIVAAAEECGGDLIVIATEKHPSLGRIILGNIAHALVRTAPCPVLVLGPDRPWQQPKRILAAIDLSRVSADVVGRSMEIAQCARAEVSVLSVFDLLWTPPWQRSPLPLDDAERAALAEEHRAAIDSLIERTRAPGIDVDRDITTEHPPSKAILEHAKALGADLIVVGASGHSGWQRLLLGSTATHVLSHAPCPVLVVPTREAR